MPKKQKKSKKKLDEARQTIEDSITNAAEEKRKTEEYQKNLKTRIAKSIIMPSDPLEKLPLNWLDPVSVCNDNLPGLADCGNGFYIATVKGKETFFLFAEEKLIGICFMCADEASFRDIISQVYRATGDYGTEYGKIVIQWDIPASNTVVQTQKNTFLGQNSYMVWCVYEDYYPHHSQISLDDVVAAAAKSDNFTLAANAVNAAVASYKYAFAKDQAKAIAQKITEAGNAWNDTMQQKLSNQHIGNTDNRTAAEIIQEVVSAYTYPGKTTKYKVK